MVEYEEAASYAEENGLLFMETSAKNANNVNEIFLAIARKLPRDQVCTAISGVKFVRAYILFGNCFFLHIVANKFTTKMIPFCRMAAVHNRVAYGQARAARMRAVMAAN